MTQALHTVQVGGASPYRISIGAGLLDDGDLLATTIRGRHALIVSDANVAPLYADRVEAALHRAKADLRIARHVVGPDIVPTFTPQQFADLGAIVELPRGFDQKLALIELENGNAPSSYRAGTQNFYVITRYNNSSYYAQSVIDLADEVEKVMRRGG